jgi:hypothetical protein
VAPLLEVADVIEVAKKSRWLAHMEEGALAHPGKQVHLPRPSVLPGKDASEHIRRVTTVAMASLLAATRQESRGSNNWRNECCCSCNLETDPYFVLKFDNCGGADGVVVLWNEVTVSAQEVSLIKEIVKKWSTSTATLQLFRRCSLQNEFSVVIVDNAVLKVTHCKGTLAGKQAATLTKSHSGLETFSVPYNTSELVKDWVLDVHLHRMLNSTLLEYRNMGARHIVRFDACMCPTSKAITVMEFEMLCAGFRTGMMTDLCLSAKTYATKLALAMRRLVRERVSDIWESTHKPALEQTLAVTGGLTKRQTVGGGASAGARGPRPCNSPRTAGAGAGASAGIAAVPRLGEPEAQRPRARARQTVAEANAQAELARSDAAATFLAAEAAKKAAAAVASTNRKHLQLDEEEDFQTAVELSKKEQQKQIVLNDINHTFMLPHTASGSDSAGGGVASLMSLTAAAVAQAVVDGKSARPVHVSPNRRALSSSSSLTHTHFPRATQAHGS